MDRLRELWYRFEGLSDVKKVAAGSAVVLFLFSSWLYCLGFLGLAVSTRQAQAVPAVTPTAEVTTTVATATMVATVAARPTIANPVGPGPTGVPEPTSSVYHPVALPTSAPEPPRVIPTATKVPAGSPTAVMSTTPTATKRPSLTPGAHVGTPTVVATPGGAQPVITPGLVLITPVPTSTPPAGNPSPTPTHVPTAPTPTPVSR